MSDDFYRFLDQMFEWSPVKAARNAELHGVRFPEAATVFFDELSIFDADLITPIMRTDF